MSCIIRCNCYRTIYPRKRKTHAADRSDTILYRTLPRVKHVCPRLKLARNWISHASPPLQADSVFHSTAGKLVSHSMLYSIFPCKASYWAEFIHKWCVRILNIDIRAICACVCVRACVYWVWAVCVKRLAVPLWLSALHTLQPTPLAMGVCEHVLYNMILLCAQVEILINEWRHTVTKERAHSRPQPFRANL